MGDAPMLWSAKREEEPVPRSAPAGLNRQQQLAVDHDAGPLIVLAGPGTGKTKVIIHRVQRLIEGGVEPEKILAVTFTVKAAEQLRQRLADLVGGAKADRVNAHTFHGLAHRLVRRFGDVLGLPGEPTIIDSAQRRRIAREAARRDGVFAAHAAEGMEVLLNEGLRHIDAFQHAGRFPDEVGRFCAEWAARIDTGAWPDVTARAAEVARHARFSAFGRLYASFAGECRARGQLTFEDLILLSVRLLRDHEMPAAICRDDYRHVVVDEFQDVNAGQIELLRHLCPPASKPHLCVVGDDDQSIYLFRGADDRAFEKFESIWTGAETIPLGENYRSEECVLAVAAATIGLAGERFAPDKNVERAESLRGRPAKAGAGVECVECDDETTQFGLAVAAMIQTDRAANPGRPWSAYAVIARSGTDLERIAAALALEDIPFVSTRGMSWREEPGVRDLLAWVEVLAAPGAAWGTQRLLVRPPIGVPAERANGWMAAYQAQSSRHRVREDGRTDAGTFLNWLRANHAGDPGVARFLALHEAVRTATIGRPAQAALMEIMRLTGLVQADLAPGRERAARVAVLADVVRLARDRARMFDPPGDLGAFWRYWQDLDERDDDAIGTDPKDLIDGTGIDEEQADAVSLLTAHKAKGLEFDTVFLPRVSPANGYPITRSSDLEMPEGFEDRAGDTRVARERRLAEERRVFYVACTRAERRLVLLAKRKKARSSSTDFFQELTIDNPGLVSCRSLADVLRQAQKAGVRLAGDALHALAPDVRAGTAEILARERRGARADAARALESVDRAGTGAPEIEAAAAALRAAAERLAAIAEVERGGKAPAWAPAEVAEFARLLAARLESGREREFALAPMKPPLRLSYSAVRAYNTCPRCFYLKTIAGLPELSEDSTNLGNLVHVTLHAHFEAVRRAEGGEGTLPDADDLAGEGRRRYFQLLGPEAQADPDALACLEAMLRGTLASLHLGTDEIVELEFEIKFPYEHEGALHNFKAKLDRLDRMPDGSHRIVDYKTGKARQSLFEPEADDLQLGVYALALRHHQGVPLEDRDTPAKGVAEYWHLPTGQRGRIDLAAIDYAKIRKQIDAAVEGMLAGEFAPAKGCERLCRVADLG